MKEVGKPASRGCSSFWRTLVPLRPRFGKDTSMFEDIDLSVGEVLPSTTVDQTGMFTTTVVTTTTITSCNTHCCMRRNENR